MQGSALYCLLIPRSLPADEGCVGCRRIQATTSRLHDVNLQAIIGAAERYSRISEGCISNSGKAELHAHTTYSDGVLSPSDLVAEAERAGLTALAITDHDIVSGVAPARASALDLDLEIVAGVEFSTNLENHEIHMLGLFVDDANDELIKCTDQARRFRRERAVEIVERLNSLGIGVEFTAVESAAGCGSIGRPHIAKAIVEADEKTDNVNEAFRRFIGIGRPAFVPKLTVGAVEVISVVHRAGGVAILAHPASSRVQPDQIGALAELGLDGFELVHPTYTSNARKKFKRLIDDMGLLPSGGSDFHGPPVGTTRLGEYAVSLQWLEALREAATSHRANTHSTEENV